MIDALVYIICFIFILSIGLAIPETPPGTIFPGSLIHDILEIPINDYMVQEIPVWKWLYAITNAVFWAFVIWICFILIMFIRSRKKQNIETRRLKYCTSCRAKIPEESSYCLLCGKKQK